MKTPFQFIEPARNPSSVVTWLAAALTPWMAYGNPQGLNVQSGAVTTSTVGSQLNVTASRNAVLNWQSFNIAPGETTVFHQPSDASIAWNRIADQNPSQIWGNLEANGVVVLMNQSGFYFGPNAMVNAAGLVVSTANAVPVDSASGLFWQFNGAPPQAQIVNFGQLHASRGGSLFLIAEHIENHGTITAPEGRVSLLAGQEVLLSSRPDGLGLTSSVRLPTGSVDNSGRILADAGTIALQAQVVNQNGLIQASSVRERNGVIELVASDAITLGEQSVISASGGSGEPSAGGRVEIKSGGSFQDSPTSRIEVAGGTSGGDGGFVEVSAPVMSAIRSTIAGQATGGGIGGRLLIDPTDIVLSNSGTGSAGSGTVGADEPGTTLELNVNSAFLGFSQINLQATGNIRLVAGTAWDLNTSTGISDEGSHLKLEAGGNISIASGASIVAGEGWSVTLEAGRNFAAPDSVNSGVGNISFAGTGSLEAREGNIRLFAGNNVTVAGGFVRTVGGGDISVEAVAGNVNSGTRANGYVFRPTGYSVDSDLGGISTAAGGDVTIKAGQDIISYMPLAGGTQTDAGTGAFGPQPGNVTLVAGNDIYGHYVVADGDGLISAGRDAGKRSEEPAGTTNPRPPEDRPPLRQLALSVIDGGWKVTAGQIIFLQEVRNPNGVFNKFGFGSSLTKHLFDYSLDAYTELNADVAVRLTGSALPRYDDDFEKSITPIYPGRLDITAGAGGVGLGNDVTLFPTRPDPTQGPFRPPTLRITTADGGSLFGTVPGKLTQLVMSDSGKTQYKAPGDFGLSDHAAEPLQFNNPEPVKLDIAGDLTGILVGAPTRAEITVMGNMVNSRFEGQNLRPGDVSWIHVTGDIVNRNEFTTVPLGQAPNFALFDLAYPPLSGDLAGLAGLFRYDSTTKNLTFQGRMTGEQQAILMALPVRKFDNNGIPIIKPNGEPEVEIVQILKPIIDPTDGQQKLQLYINSQDIPLDPDSGYRIGGGGRLEITAHNLDLGATDGIVSQGPRANHALAKYFTQGSELTVNVDGNLDMFSTTISSLNGGHITVVAEGDINVGSQYFTGNIADARGIFTVAKSDVTVVSTTGDINVNGSRIATYDGGNVTVRSLEGNVDAGTGGSGFPTVEMIYVDPGTRKIYTYAPGIAGSGILATTFPRSAKSGFPAPPNEVGDILVETPHGDILASAAGIVQWPDSGANQETGHVTLRAGTANGEEVVHVGNINVSGSGVIGSNVSVEATGKIDALVVSRGDAQVSGRETVNVTVLAQGNVNVSSGGNISGTIIGLGSVNASGATVDAALLSQNVSTSGDVTSSQVGFSQGTTANSTSQSLQAEEKSNPAETTNTDDDKNQKKPGRELPLLTRTVGRVTVILPKP